jgi:ABC-type transport system involved in multi-copper enzyme maturation permease subunit
VALRNRAVFLSLAWREAKVAARKRRLYMVRVIIAAACMLAIPLTLRGASSATNGEPLFQTMSWMAFIYCLFAGVLRTSDTLAEEKREGTLGLLLLTDLRPTSVLLGKMLSASATVFFGLLAILPMLAFPILIGGVSKDQVLRVSLNLLNTLFLSTAWGLLISALARRNIVTTLLAFFVPVCFAGLLSLLAICILDRGRVSEAVGLILALPSPGFTHLASHYDNPEAIKFFWDSLATNHILAWGALLLAAAIFPRRAHDTPSASSAPAIQRREKRLRELRYGDPRARLALRRHLLEFNPLIWLVNRDRLDSIILCAICAAILLLGLFLKAPDWAVFISIFTILFRMAHEASHSVSEDQKSGALELLLSTRLSVAEIIHGRVQGIRRRFLSAVLLITVWNLASAKIWQTPITLPIAVSVWLIACWFAIAWAGPWFALRAKKPASATWMTILAVTMPPFGAWGALSFPSLFNSLSFADHAISITACAWVGVGHCLLMIHWSKQMLFKNFRAAAADHFATRKFEGIFTTGAEPDHPAFGRLIDARRI